MLLVLALLVGFVGQTGVDEEERSVALEIAVPRRATAEAQLEYARGLKRRLSERKPEEREFWRELAVEAYQAVRVHHPDRPDVGSEAAFRAGELLRAAGIDERAIKEFTIASRLGSGGRFAHRALLETGHVHRRAGRARKALDRYHEVVSARSVAPRVKDDAWLWVGRLQAASERFEDAFRAWKTVARGAGDPLDRVQAYDWWAITLVERNDLEGAAGVLHEARQRLREAVLEETPFGDQVRRAMERMRAVDRLLEAIEKRESRDDGAQAWELD